ncbi:hypothetical protein [Sporomusa sp. GT1]|uniref:hypothetical protein n=1 Tax=Sporomusa sp. GT1 TaxID=1534747 RepID=UPI00166B6000|nr:hypothetical protein [Sporomusa sp. GT1]
MPVNLFSWLLTQKGRAALRLLKRFGVRPLPLSAAAKLWCYIVFASPEDDKIPNGNVKKFRR